jgi:hypothetical protein
MDHMADRTYTAPDWEVEWLLWGMASAQTSSLGPPNGLGNPRQSYW